MVIIIITIITCFLFFWNFSISPNMDNIAAMKAKAMVTQMVNDVIHEKFEEQLNINNLLVIQTDNEGSIELVQSNTPAINTLITGISKELQISYSKVEPYELSVPLGAILGSQIFSQTGPSVYLKILPLSVSGMDFKTEFETAGINQTKYKVYVILRTEARVLAPFTTNTIEIKNTVLIAEAVILGKVPQSYVSVPKEEILDGMDSSAAAHD